MKRNWVSGQCPTNNALERMRTKGYKFFPSNDLKYHNLFGSVEA
ncbi:hypothetical protein AGR7B_Lc70004 [Agrobacterium deltaense RV3]|nr:hypothetical protein AGR7B_Lc70004 [Agrobacterium deltaense RV3]